MPPSSSSSPYSFKVGDIVEVARRKWPGINDEGGVGTIQEIHVTKGRIEQVDVKYLLSNGTSRHIAVEHVQHKDLEVERTSRRGRGKRELYQPTLPQARKSKAAAVARSAAVKKGTKTAKIGREKSAHQNDNDQGILDGQRAKQAATQQQTRKKKEEKNKTNTAPTTTAKNDNTQQQLHKKRSREGADAAAAAAGTLVTHTLNTHTLPTNTATLATTSSRSSLNVPTIIYATDDQKKISPLPLPLLGKLKPTNTAAVVTIHRPKVLLPDSKPTAQSNNKKRMGCHPRKTNTTAAKITQARRLPLSASKHASKMKTNDNHKKQKRKGQDEKPQSSHKSISAHENLHTPKRPAPPKLEASLQLPQKQKHQPNKNALSLVQQHQSKHSSDDDDDRNPKNSEKKSEMPRNDDIPVRLDEFMKLLSKFLRSNGEIISFDQLSQFVEEQQRRRQQQRNTPAFTKPDIRACLKHLAKTGRLEEYEGDYIYL